MTIDLGHVERIDAEGVSALVGSARRAQNIGAALRIVNVRPRVKKALERAGVRDLLVDPHDKAATPRYTDPSKSA